MFYDRARIWVKGGDGGNGIVAFRREKHVPKGGPSGGDGGNGGSVVFVVDEGLRTLMDFHYRRHFRAGRGQHGRGDNMKGRDGDDLLVKVPPGTVVIDESSGGVLGDLTRPGETLVVAPGGRGGRGNARFATATNRTPRHAEPGQAVDEFAVILELKLLADAGLVGLPNAGKSTLLARVSAARPKIADYPFTTLTPNLGVVEWAGGSFVLADVPGLIAGAHTGKGLGHQFLRHIERTRVVVYVVEVAVPPAPDPAASLRMLRSELESYSASLLERHQLVAANKIDLPGAGEGFGTLEPACQELGLPVYPISAVTGEGVDQLVAAIGRALADSTT